MTNYIIRFFYRLISCSLLAINVSFIQSQNISLKGDDWKILLNENGTIQHIITQKGESDTIKFSRHQKYGPVFYVCQQREDIFKYIIPEEHIGTWEKIDGLTYYTLVDDLGCTMRYQVINKQLVLGITISNQGNTLVQPFKAGIKLGIDTYMDQFPDWLDAYFPTLLRNEKTHFWGYLMTPKQNILVLSSPDPVASWSLDYNYNTHTGNDKDKPYYWGQHRIEGINLDLINALPLPERCPQHLYQLAPGQSYTWHIYISPISNIKELAKTVRTNTQAPFWEMPQTTLAVGEFGTFNIYADSQPEVYLNEKKMEITQCGEKQWLVNYRAEKPGIFTLKAKANNKVSEAILTVRHAWDWYLDKARSEAERCPQKATTHIESWYGYTSAFIAAREIPQNDIDQRHAKRFDYLYNLLHKNDIPQIIPYRIQNTSGTIDLLVLKYKAHKQIEDIEKASHLADWLIKFSQRNDGSFRNFLSENKDEQKGTIYTSVIYPLKSIMDLAFVEKELSVRDKKWKKIYKRHLFAVKKAIDHLVSLHGNIQTEGEMTYEDGMIACSALQIAYWALFEEESDKQKYIDEALSILKGHDCLTQLQIPDGRQRGGTLRFWESQYDVLMVPNFMNSPHGWSAWRGYATYYVYLLTGDERWLQESYNAAGSFVQLIDADSGRLRWAFCANPFLPVQMVCEPHPTASIDSITQYHLQPLQYKTSHFVLGEQYIDMVSNFMFFNTQDNDVHEVFKFIGESFLNQAFVVEREDGTWKGYNCIVKNIGNEVQIIPSEKLVKKIHFNIKQKRSIIISTNRGEESKIVSPMKWIDI